MRGSRQIAWLAVIAIATGIIGCGDGSGSDPGYNGAGSVEINGGKVTFGSVIEEYDRATGESTIRMRQSWPPGYQITIEMSMYLGETCYDSCNDSVWVEFDGIWAESWDLDDWDECFEVCISEIATEDGEGTQGTFHGVAIDESKHGDEVYLEDGKFIAKRR
ncbi:MAG: hypothetical protein O6952_05675 [Planctomycetota bacterium]|nr:hypothetical protein [Planctomycetota bacterium]